MSRSPALRRPDAPARHSCATWQAATQGAARTGWVRLKVPETGRFEKSGNQTPPVENAEIHASRPLSLVVVHDRSCGIDRNGCGVSKFDNLEEIVLVRRLVRGGGVLGGPGETVSAHHGDQVLGAQNSVNE
jgi:hypothetical protein